MPTQDQPRTRVTSKVETVKETIPAAQGAQVSEFYDRPFWEIIHSLTRDEWRSHLVRVYRSDERWEHTVSLQENKFTEDFSEDTIFAKWGGGRFLLWLYGPPEGKKLVMAPFRMEIEGQPKFFSGAPAAGAVESRSNDPVLQMVLDEMREMRKTSGGSMLQDTLKASLEIMATAYKSSAAVIRETSPGAGAIGGVVDEFEKQFRQALLQRMLEPPKAQDPMESIKAMVAMGTGIVSAVKELSGSLALGGKQDIWAIFADKLPMLGEKAVEGLREYRLAAEAQTKAISLQGGRIIDATPVGTGTSPADTGTTATTGQPPASQQTPEVVEVQGPSLTWILLKVQKTIEESEQTQATGEDLYDFLINIAPEIIDQLKGQPRDQIIHLFRTHPALSPALGKVANHPRLPKMIDEFLAVANAPAEGAQPKPN